MLDALRDVGPDALVGEGADRPGLVVALVRDDLLDLAPASRLVIIGVVVRVVGVAAACSLQVLLGELEAALHRLRVARRSRHHVDREQRAALHVDDVFGLVSEAGPPVLEAHDLCVRIGRALPVLVRRLLTLALLVEASQLLVARVLDPRFLRELAEVALVALAASLADDRLHRGVGSEVRRVDPGHLALREALLVEDPHHEPEHLLVGPLRQSRARPRERRVIRRWLVRLVPEEPLERERVLATPADPPLRLDPLEVSDQQHPEVHAGRDRRPPTFAPRLVREGTQSLHVLVEPRVPE